MSKKRYYCACGFNTTIKKSLSSHVAKLCRKEPGIHHKVIEPELAKEESINIEHTKEDIIEVDRKSVIKDILYELYLEVMKIENPLITEKKVMKVASEPVVVPDRNISSPTIKNKVSQKTMDGRKYLLVVGIVLLLATVGLLFIYMNQ